MKVVDSIAAMREESRRWRREGRSIALVPTMGYLHEGHISLIREGRKKADCLVVSIYVNPTQFAPGEDFERYPRDFTRDAELCRQAGVDVIFQPDSVAMYPSGYLTYVNVENITERLCGAARPGHFRGVTTVCAKLFLIVSPHLAVFGKKDFQQLQVVKKMVADLNMDLEILGMPTLREPDGLAMSSRNVYLSAEERESATGLYISLCAAKKIYDAGERDAGVILASVRKVIEGRPHAVIDYARIVDTLEMRDLAEIEREAVLVLAVRVGATRLIDNYVFGEDLFLCQGVK